MPLKVLALALVVALMHLVESQAKPSGEGLSGMHARGACCCAKEAATLVAPLARASTPTEDACCAGPAALATADPQVEKIPGSDCATVISVDRPVAQVENEDGSCCSKSGSSCACHHYGPTVSAWVVGGYTVTCPLAPATRHAILSERSCQRPCTPPEQPPRA